MEQKLEFIESVENFVTDMTLFKVVRALLPLGSYLYTLKSTESVFCGKITKIER